jgi:hypothetical protein
VRPPAVPPPTSANFFSAIVRPDTWIGRY